MMLMLTMMMWSLLVNIVATIGCAINGWIHRFFSFIHSLGTCYSAIFCKWILFIQPSVYISVGLCLEDWYLKNTPRLKSEVWVGIEAYTSLYETYLRVTPHAEHALQLHSIFFLYPCLKLLAFSMFLACWYIETPDHPLKILYGLAH